MADEAPPPVEEVESVLLGLWRFIAALGAYLWIALRGYRTWSQFYRWVWERKFRDVQISTFPSLQKLSEFMRGGTLWRSDSWKEMFDAVSSPQRCQQIFAGIEPIPEHGLDCDEHAVYLVAAIEKSLAEGVLKDAVAAPRFLTVMWLDGWEAGGHNVCLLEIPPAPGGTSPRYAFMDYGLPSASCASVQEVVDLVRRNYAKPGFKPLSWAVSKGDLTPELVRWA